MVINILLKKSWEICVFWSVDLSVFSLVYMFKEIHNGTVIRSYFAPFTEKDSTPASSYSNKYFKTVLILVYKYKFM